VAAWLNPARLSGVRGLRKSALGLAAAGLAAAVVLPAAAAAGPPKPVISPITQVSRGCLGPSDEIEQAVDAHLGYVYEEWIGCDYGIAFATSTDGGLHFGKPIMLPDSLNGWDPSVAVAPDGTVYAAFMNATGQHMFPVVAESFDHGKTFARVIRLVPKHVGNWGDRDFIAVGPTGTVYLDWDYGPSRKDVTLLCPPGGSCSFATGDLNIVMRKSTDRGRIWGPMVHVTPGFPASGADLAPLLVEPDGRIYVEYQGYRMASHLRLTTAHSFVTTSAAVGKTWSRPVRIGPARLAMDRTDWWIDGDITTDSVGNLYVTWDTQSGGHDIGWLSYSTDHGKHWSALVRVTPDTDRATHIVEAAGAHRGVAYVGWLADNSARGYALYLRPFSVTKGWLSAPIQVSRSFGNRLVWPGDTFGISVEPAAASGPRAGWPRVVVSWGSAVGGRNTNSQDRAAVVAFPPAG
jgi:hypothetical protein